MPPTNTRIPYTPGSESVSTHPPTTTMGHAKRRKIRIVQGHGLRVTAAIPPVSDMRARSFLCPDAHCGKRFAASVNVQRHYKSVHLKLRPHACTHPQCHNTYTTAWYCRDHMHRAHGTSGGTPRQQYMHTRTYGCGECGKTYSDPSTLRRHRLTHRPPAHACDLCTNMFRQRHQLVAHRKCHTKESPHHCSPCDRYFPTRSGLILHQHSRARLMCAAIVVR